MACPTAPPLTHPCRVGRAAVPLSLGVPAGFVVYATAAPLPPGSALALVTCLVMRAPGRDRGPPGDDDV